MVFLAKSPLINQYNLTSLHVMYCGAAPLSKQIEMDVKKRIGVKFIRQGYGMTEGTFAFCLQNDDYCTEGSVGSLRRTITIIIRPENFLKSVKIPIERFYAM